MANIRADRICHVCNREYSRAEHLRRHLLSHSNLASFHCTRCERRFRRRDALRRHLTTCVGGKGDKSLRSGNLKQHLPQRQPTTTTQRDNHLDVSTHEDARTSYSQALGKWSEFQDAPTALPQADCNTRTNLHPVLTHLEEGNLCETRYGSYQPVGNESTYSDPKVHRSLSANQSYLPATTTFDFLVHFTSGYDLQSCFKSSCPVLADLSFCVEGPTLETPLLCSTLDPFEDARTVHHSDCDLEWPFCADPGHLSGKRQVADLAAKTSEICSAIRFTSSAWSQLQEASCQHFFAPQRLLSFLDLYWLYWYPNWPVIHRPTFDARKCPTHLLAAMAVTGARHSPLSDDREDAWSLFDAVERLAFFFLQSQMDGASVDERIQHIQAAFLACIYQTWDGSLMARKRIRNVQFNVLVTAVRSLDMTALRHERVSTAEQFNWSEHVSMEQRIRTIMWVFCLDTAFVIFNNTPPRLALRELRLGLASCEASFQAENAQNCFERLRDWQARNPRPPDRSLYGLINMLCKPGMCLQTLNNLAHESFVNLWCVISAIHVLVYNLEPMLGSNHQFETLRTALNNIDRIWQQRLKNDDEQYFDSIVVTALHHESIGVARNTWKRTGFWSNAAEYWLLAHLQLNCMESARQGSDAADELSGVDGLHREVTGHSNDRVDSDSMQSLHEFLISANLNF